MTLPPNFARSSWSVSIERPRSSERTSRARRTLRRTASTARRGGLPAVPPRTGAAPAAVGVIRIALPVDGRELRVSQRVGPPDDVLDGSGGRAVRADVDEARARLLDRDGKISGDSHVDARLGFPFEVSLEVDPSRQGTGGLALWPHDHEAGIGGGDLEALEDEVARRSRRERKVLKGHGLRRGGGAQPGETRASSSSSRSPPSRHPAPRSPDVLRNGRGSATGA